MSEPTVAGYRPVRVLRRDALGDVYHAIHEKTNSAVCLRVVTSPSEINAGRWVGIRYRLIASLLALQQIETHPGIEMVLGVGEVDNGIWVVSEFSDGTTLEERRQTSGPTPFSEAIPLLKSVAETLDAAHARRTTHGWLDAQHVLLTREGKVKVLGFALGLVPGLVSPKYAAPERESSDPTPASDLFSFGVLVRKVLGSEQATLGVRAVLERLTAEDPSARYTCALAAMEDLEKGYLPGTMPASVPAGVAAPESIPPVTPPVAPPVTPPVTPPVAVVPVNEAPTIPAPTVPAPIVPAPIVPAPPAGTPFITPASSTPASSTPASSTPASPVTGAGAQAVPGEAATNPPVPIVTFPAVASPAITPPRNGAESAPASPAPATEEEETPTVRLPPGKVPAFAPPLPAAPQSPAAAAGTVPAAVAPAVESGPIHQTATRPAPRRDGEQSVMPGLKPTQNEKAWVFIALGLLAVALTALWFFVLNRPAATEDKTSPKSASNKPTGKPAPKKP